jgi:hypothetical protein
LVKAEGKPAAQSWEAHDVDAPKSVEGCFITFNQQEKWEVEVNHLHQFRSFSTIAITIILIGLTITITLTTTIHRISREIVSRITATLQSHTTSIWFGPAEVVNGCRIAGAPPWPTAAAAVQELFAKCHELLRLGGLLILEARRGDSHEGRGKSPMNSHGWSSFSPFEKILKMARFMVFSFQTGSQISMIIIEKNMKNTSISRSRVNWIHLTWSPKIRMNSVGLAATKIETWTVGLKMCGRENHSHPTLHGFLWATDWYLSFYTIRAKKKPELEGGLFRLQSRCISAGTRLA